MVTFKRSAQLFASSVNDRSYRQRCLSRVLEVVSGKMLTKVTGKSPALFDGEINSHVESLLCAQIINSPSAMAKCTVQVFCFRAAAKSMPG